MKPVVLAFCAMAAPAMADDYPYPGVFTTIVSTTAPADGPLQCAFNFFLQDHSGTGNDYVLDRKVWKEKGVVSFVPVDHFVCTYDAKNLTEDCQFSEVAYPDGPTALYTKLIQITPDNTTLAIFNDKISRLAYVLHGATDAQVPIFHYLHCGFFDEATLKPYLGHEASSLSPAEAAADLADPFDGDTSGAMRQMARDIIAKVGR